MSDKKDLMAIQPFIELYANDYRELKGDQYGIACFYEFHVKSEEESQVQAVPDGSIDFLFGIGTDDVWATVSGTVLCAQNWTLQNDREYFGVRFQPGTCLLPQDFTIKDVVNEHLEIGQSGFTQKIMSKLSLGMTLEEKRQIFLEYYEKLLKGRTSKADKLEEYTRKRIYESNGTVAILDIAKETGYSECYIRRTFEKVHGISPKLFEKFVRFQTVIMHINEEDRFTKLEDIAIKYGYYDQSHMIKEFKQFTGMTPEKYRKLIAKNIVSIKSICEIKGDFAIAK